VDKDGDAPRERKEVDVAEEDGEAEDTSSEPALRVVARAVHIVCGRPRAIRPWRHGHVAWAERLVVRGSKGEAAGVHGGPVVVDSKEEIEARPNNNHPPRHHVE